MIVATVGLGKPDPAADGPEDDTDRLGLVWTSRRLSHSESDDNTAGTGLSANRYSAPEVLTIGLVTLKGATAVEHIWRRIRKLHIGVQSSQLALRRLQ